MCRSEAIVKCSQASLCIEFSIAIPVVKRLGFKKGDYVLICPTPLEGKHKTNTKEFKQYFCEPAPEDLKLARRRIPSLAITIRKKTAKKCKTYQHSAPLNRGSM
jgi:hypothetical protein